MTLVTIDSFLTASLRRRCPGGLQTLSPLEQAGVDRIADQMDRELADMVRQLEAAARCQQEERVLSSAEPMPPFTAFCVGLERIASMLMPHLFDRFAEISAAESFSPSDIGWIACARADAFAAYLVQLARVHGIAGEMQVRSLDEAEKQALADLERTMQMMIRQSRF